MTPVEIISVVIAIIASLYAIAGSRSGIKDGVIGAYEKRVKQLEDDVKELSDKIDGLKKSLDQSEIDRRRAEEILQGRNPELDRFMTVAMQMLVEIHGAVLPQTVAPVSPA